MRFRCPGCSGLFELDQLPPGGLARCPTCLTTVKVGSSPAAAGVVRSLPKDPDFRSIPSVTFPPATLPAYLTDNPVPPPPQFQPPNLREGNVAPPDWNDAGPRAQRSGVSTGVKVVFWVLGGFAALFVGILALAGFGYYAVTQTNWLNAEMTLAGYQTSAPGKLVAVQSGSLGQSEVGVLNRTTGSQFQMIFVPEGAAAVRVTPEVFMMGLGMKATIVEQSNVNRAGLSGTHFKTANMRGSGDMEGEVFAVQGGVLIVAYQSAHDLSGQRGKVPKYSPEKERSLDRPDDFFASLRPQSAGRQ